MKLSWTDQCGIRNASLEKMTLIKADSKNYNYRSFKSMQLTQKYVCTWVKRMGSMKKFFYLLVSSYYKCYLYKC